MSNEAEQERKRELGSEFLRQCVSYLMQVQGANDFTSIPSRFRESVTTCWFPEVKDGMPTYDERHWGWDFFVSRKREYITSVNIHADGRVLICEGDDPEPGVYLDLKLKHPFELGEVLELIQQLTDKNCDQTTFQEVPWSSIIQEVFVLVPGDKEQKLIKFSWAGWASKMPELLQPFRFAYLGEIEGLNAMQYSTWREWLERSGKLASLDYAGELKEDDLLYSPSDGFQGARTAFMGYRPWQDWEPRLVVRLKPQQSRMYFIDFVEHTKEGEVLHLTLEKDLERLPQILNQTRVKYPANRLSQIRLGVELRVAKCAYEDKVHSLMRIREPAEKLQERYQLRTKNVQGLHTEYLEELHSMQHPLPFLIEYPRRRFSRADDRLVKIKYGQRLLNLLAKLPLFLALEESRAKPECKQLTAPIEARLFGKPASDGTLAECLRDVQTLVHEKKVLLPWFGRLIQRYRQEGEEHLAKLIKPLNRYKHPPYDDRTFLNALEAEIPVLINLFRECLDGLLFIAPESQNQQGANHVVSARVLMGFDVDFLKRDLLVTAPFEVFPAGELVVVDSKLDRALVLSRLFKSQPIHTISLDIGVFDRVVEGHPEFVFIRGLDQE